MSESITSHQDTSRPSSHGSLPLGTDNRASCLSRVESLIAASWLVPGPRPPDSAPLAQEDAPSGTHVAAAGEGDKSRTSEPAAENQATTEEEHDHPDHEPATHNADEPEKPEWEREEDRVAARLKVLMAGIGGDSKAIAALEAARLIKIADLYAEPCMRPQATPAADGKATHTSLTRQDLTEAELRHLLHLSDYEARLLTELAVALNTRLPETLNALGEGRLDRRRAEIIHQHTKPLADDHYQQARAANLSSEAAEQAARNIAALMEKRLLRYAPGQAPTGLNRSARKAVMVLDPEYANRKAAQDLRSRKVTHRIDPDSNTGTVSATLGALDALAVYEILDAYARLARHRGDTRTLDELRADTFTHLVLYGSLPDETTVGNGRPARIIPRPAPYENDLNKDDIVRNHTCDLGEDTAHDDDTLDRSHATARDREAATGSHDGASFWPASFRPPASAAATAAGELTEDPQPAAAQADSRPCTCGGRTTGSGVRAHVLVTMGFDTLLGLDDEPAEVAGLGPITAAQARELAFANGSTWRRLVTDPVTGYLLNCGRTTYRPPTALGDHVRARDVTCRTPNCNRPATKCDLDHIVRWPTGTTSEDNLCAQCRRDHRLKHEGGWRHEISDDPTEPPGTVKIISPAGQVYYSFPFAYPTGTREHRTETPDPTMPYGRTEGRTEGEGRQHSSGE